MRAGWERETQPSVIMISQWAAILPKVYGSCWVLPQARLRAGLPGTCIYDAKRMFVGTFDEVLIALIKLREALDSTSINKDANVARVWSALYEGCSYDRSYLGKMWAELKSWALDPHLTTSRTQEPAFPPLPSNLSCQKCSATPKSKT